MCDQRRPEHYRSSAKREPIHLQPGPATYTRCTNQHSPTVIVAGNGAAKTAIGHLLPSDVLRSPLQGDVEIRIRAPH